MARSANVKQQPKEGLSEELKRRLREAGALLLMPLALYLLICLLTYDARDPSWTNANQINLVQNFGGTFGAHIADLLRWIFGYVAYCFPLLLLLLGVQVLRQHGERTAHAWEDRRAHV